MNTDRIERKRYFEISRGSLIEIDAALDVANELDYLMNIDSEILGDAMITCFKMLTGLLIQSKMKLDKYSLFTHSQLTFQHLKFQEC